MPSKDIERKREVWRNWYHRNKSDKTVSKYYREKNQRRRNLIRNFIENYKKGKSCRCGFSDYRALQFHHIDPSTKEFTIGTFAASNGISLKRIQEEIKKCEIICANCHFIEHYGKQRTGVQFPHI